MHWLIIYILHFCTPVMRNWKEFKVATTCFELRNKGEREKSLISLKYTNGKEIFCSNIFFPIGTYQALVG